MFCATCGQHIRDGAHFCESCGTQLEVPAATTREAPAKLVHTYHEGSDPYKDQITQLRLHLKQLKLELKQITTDMSNKRSQYHETAAFVPRGLLRHGYKMVEDVRLWEPQQRKQQLQQEIMQLEQELLGLQEAQAAWKMQH